MNMMRPSSLRRTNDVVHHLFVSQFNYEVNYFLRKAKISRRAVLNDRHQVPIREVALAAAPVAYRISSIAAGIETYEVLSGSAPAGLGRSQARSENSSIRRSVRNPS
jgi:hypothetical protein